MYQKLIQRLDEGIDRLYTELHPDDHLRTIPGLGAVLAPYVLAVIHSAARFGRQKRLRGYIGLFPRRAESGGQDGTSQRLVKSGNNCLKRDLLLAADIARRFDPGMASVYRDMMMVKGKHHMQALCAVANRLVHRIYAVLKEGRPYVLRDLDGREITLAEAKALVEARYSVPPNIRFARRKGAHSGDLAA